MNESTNASLWRVEWTKEDLITAIFPGNWRYVTHICNIDCTEATDAAPDMFALLAREPDVIMA